jgi:hypothetical protein
MKRRELMLQSLAALSAGPAFAEAAAPLLVRRIDHIQVEPPEPAAMMAALQRDFGLPALWPYADYGAFSSGGLVLGNVVLEIGRLGRTADVPPGLTGMALEPALASALLPSELDRRGLGHGRPAPYPPKPGAAPMWTTTRIDGFAPLRLFFCEYHIDTATGLAAAGTALAAQGGGPLGLLGVREVAVATALPGLPGAPDPWAALLAPTRSQAAGAYTLAAGPALQLLPGSAPGIRWLTLDVASPAQAARALRERGFEVDASDGSLFRGEGAMTGLALRLP